MTCPSSHSHAHIALLHYAGPPLIGGVEQVLAEHARLFADRGFPVRVVVGQGSMFRPDIPVFEIPAMHSQHADVRAVKLELDQGICSPAFTKLRDDLVQNLEEALAPATHIIAHNICSLVKNLALTAAFVEYARRHPEKKYILWHHDLATSSGQYNAELHTGYPWDLVSSPPFWGQGLNGEEPGQHCVHVAVSYARAQEVAQTFGIPQEHVQVIPSGLHLDVLFGWSDAGKSLIQELALENAWPILLCPVRITRRKNLELGMRATMELRKIFPQCTLVITGPLGAHNSENLRYATELQNLLRKNSSEILSAANLPIVHFLYEKFPDGTSSEIMRDLFALCDIVLLTSRDEGLGVPVLEAGAWGRPLLCTDIPALREVSAGHAELFPPQIAPAELAEQIRKVLNERDCRLRQRTREDFSWNHICERQLLPLVLPCYKQENSEVCSL